jgi:hypothetical protein
MTEPRLAEAMLCEFCSASFDQACGRYGCPNCCGEGLTVTSHNGKLSPHSKEIAMTLMRSTKFVTCRTNGAVCHEHRSEKSAHSYCKWLHGQDNKDVIVLSVEEWQRRFPR